MEEECHDNAMFTYEEVPFNMIGSIKNFEFWDKELIAACVEFKRKFDKWPTALLASDATYEKFEESVRLQLGEPDCDEEDDEFDFDIEDTGESDKNDDDEEMELIKLYNEDLFENDEEPNPNKRRKIDKDYFGDQWDDFDTNIPLEEIKPEGMPIEFGQDFATPFFRLELLVDNKFPEGTFRLMYGEGPGIDDGEEIPEAEEKVA